MYKSKLYATAALAGVSALVFCTINASGATFAPRVRLKDGTSVNWSGYAVETNLTNPESNAVTNAKGSWVVPALTCDNAAKYSAAWVGIDGYSDNSVEQTGTEQDCSGGKASYYAWYEIYPKPSFKVNLAVHAGDTMAAEVKYLGNNRFELMLADATTGKIFETTQKSNARRESAEWIMEAPSGGGVLPLANFGIVNFSGASATLNGRVGTIGDNAWQNDAITMTNASNIAKATPSGLSPDGSGFSVAWQGSN